MRCPGRSATQGQGHDITPLEQRTTDLSMSKHHFHGITGIDTVLPFRFILRTAVYVSRAGRCQTVSRRSDTLQ